MAFDPASFIIVTYNRGLVGQPVALCTTSGHQSKVCLLTLPWATFTTGGVQALLTGGTVNALDKIIGCYIDNTRNTATVAVYFPDTGYIVSVPPFEALFCPVFTNNFLVQIFNVDRVTTSGMTQVFLTNFLTDSFDSTSGFPSDAMFQQISSPLPVSTELSNPVYTSVKAGDKYVIGTMELNGSFNLTMLNPYTVNILNLYYVTNVKISIQDALRTDGGLTGTYFNQWTFQLNIGSTKTRNVKIRVKSDRTYIPYQIIYERPGEYITSSGSDLISMQTFAPALGTYAGLVTFSFDYATLPTV